MELFDRIIISTLTTLMILPLVAGSRSESPYLLMGTDVTRNWNRAINSEFARSTKASMVRRSRLMPQTKVICELSSSSPQQNSSAVVVQVGADIWSPVSMLNYIKKRRRILAFEGHHDAWHVRVHLLGFFHMYHEKKRS